MRVFLGGTCASQYSDVGWRGDLIPQLNQFGIDYFNPVVEDWTPQDRENEEKEKELADVVLYVITPDQTGFYSFAEIMDSVWSAMTLGTGKTVFCPIDYNNKIFTDAQWKSLQAIGEMVLNREGYFVTSFNDLMSLLLKFKANEIY